MSVEINILLALAGSTMEHAEVGSRRALSPRIDR